MEGTWYSSCRYKNAMALKVREIEEKSPGDFSAIHPCVAACVLLRVLWVSLRCVAACVLLRVLWVSLRCVAACGVDGECVRAFATPNYHHQQPNINVTTTNNNDNDDRAAATTTTTTTTTATTTPPSSSSSPSSPPPCIIRYVKGELYRKSFQETGDIESSCWSCGQVMGLIDDVPDCKTLLETIVSEAEDIIRRLPKLLVSAKL
jgi:hypothetical protein